MGHIPAVFPALPIHVWERDGDDLWLCRGSWLVLDNLLAVGVAADRLGVALLVAAGLASTGSAERQDPFLGVAGDRRLLAISQVKPDDLSLIHI